MKDWCEHIKWQEYGTARIEKGGFWGYSDSQKHPTNICKDWVECPECKTPRPEPVETLTEKINKTVLNFSDSLSGTRKTKILARIAIDHCLETIDKWSDTGEFGLDSLRQALRDSL